MAGKFYSVRTNEQLPAPNTGNPGDCWYITSTGLLWFIEGTGNPVQLLNSVPIPVSGPQGVQGPPGRDGVDYVEHFPDLKGQIGGVTATIKKGGADADGWTGYFLTGVETGQGVNYERE